VVKRQKNFNAQTAAQTGTMGIVLWDFFGVWRFGVWSFFAGDLT
jgi:hypothetical protein